MKINGGDDNTTVQMCLRDFANRHSSTNDKKGKKNPPQCIRRVFLLTFLSVVEAESFLFAHNRFLRAQGPATAKKKRRQITKTKDEEEKDETKKCPASSSPHQGRKKRRKIFCIDPEEVENQMAKKENQEEETAAMEEFQKSNEFTFLDDAFPDTQDPFA